MGGTNGFNSFDNYHIRDSARSWAGDVLCCEMVEPEDSRGHASTAFHFHCDPVHIWLGCGSDHVPSRGIPGLCRSRERCRLRVYQSAFDRVRILGLFDLEFLLPDQLLLLRDRTAREVL